MLILPDVKLDYKDVLIVPQRSTLDSRSSVDLLRNFNVKWNKIGFKCCPIIASNMWNTGTVEMAKALKQHGCLTALHKFYSLEDLTRYIYPSINYGSELCFITIGEDNQSIELLKDLKEKINNNLLFINIDVANGYRASFANFVKRVREVCLYDIIMAGNVTTPEMTQELILAGADIVKIGIGPGSVCETRRVAGVGYPMLSAIIECANAAHGLRGHICADGGCKTPADVAKAFCAGADFVMLGGMLAGTDECQGEWIDEGYKDIDWEWSAANPNGPGIQYKWFSKRKLKFFGMSSHEAMKKFGGAERNYRASEGIVSWVDYKGPVSNVMDEVLGGLRSCGTYIGAERIKDFSRCATFVRIN